MLADIPNPWRAFLRDIDALLGSQRSDGPPVELHCIGGFVEIFSGTFFNLKLRVRTDAHPSHTQH